MATEKQKAAARKNIKKAQAASAKRGPAKKKTSSGAMTEAARDRLSDAKFAFPDDRKEPLNDAKHVRNAIARFDQVEGVSDAEKKANEIADYFADFNRHQSHNLGIDRDQAKAVGVKIDDLEADSQLQDAVLSVHHAMLVTFQGPAVKIVENHAGKAFVKVAQQIAVQVPMQPQPPGGAPTLLPGTPPAP